MAPTFGNGKICYLELPAKDVAVSARFYKQVFGWNTRTRSDGSTAFDDGVGEVSGSWVTDREPATGNGLRTGPMVHIMVDHAQATVEKIRHNGGEIVCNIGEYARTEIVAIFRDPAGNMLGIYQHRGTTPPTAAAAVSGSCE